MEPTPLGPVVCQAIDDIHALVEHGALRAGRLPSERELAVRLGVSRSTVHAALAHMRDEGQVEVRRGRNGGAYVLDSGSRRRPTMPYAMTAALIICTLSFALFALAGYKAFYLGRQ